MITDLASFDVEASLAAGGRPACQGALKVWEDLARYERVLAISDPELIIECGTYNGGSAVWFADHDIDVITIDVNPSPLNHPHVMFLLGNSTAEWVVTTATREAAGRRTMVVLDSDHSATHVTAEIDAYGPLVTPGCYLVVEDGIVRWMHDQPYQGSPLDAIEERLVGNPDWARDHIIEAMYPVTMFPAGWWARKH